MVQAADQQSRLGSAIAIRRLLNYSGPDVSHHRGHRGSQGTTSCTSEAALLSLFLCFGGVFSDRVLSLPRDLSSVILRVLCGAKPNQPSRFSLAIGTRRLRNSSGPDQREVWVLASSSLTLCADSVRGCLLACGGARHRSGSAGICRALDGMWSVYLVGISPFEHGTCPDGVGTNRFGCRDALCAHSLPTRNRVRA